MPDVLSEICGVKRRHVAECKARAPYAEIARQARAQVPARGFTQALRSAASSGRYVLIAEIKKASPSKGLIRADFDPPSLARAYQKGGAACLSVLTDGPYFQGSDAYLIAARNAVDLPVLRKDFMLDPYQIAESRALGADCVLLIMAALSDAQAAELEAVATEFGLDVLLEVHDVPEMDRALKLASPLIGVNNRNLKTLQVDLQATVDLAPMLPKDRLLVCESGLASRADLARMAGIGADAFLIGESLMRQADVAAATRALIGDSISQVAQ
ncbi:MAG: indole-3-glycerol phosphate synthase TrpC [Proteobacteria bacterium]|nr:indole-3-glycerol phosphate synthase TrpC [Pseudomonadota bacterium]